MLQTVHPLTEQSSHNLEVPFKKKPFDVLQTAHWVHDPVIQVRQLFNVQSNTQIKFTILYPVIHALHWILFVVFTKQVAQNDPAQFSTHSLLLSGAKLVGHEAMQVLDALL